MIVKCARSLSAELDPTGLGRGQTARKMLGGRQSAPTTHHPTGPPLCSIGFCEMRHLVRMGFFKSGPVRDPRYIGFRCRALTE